VPWEKALYRELPKPIRFGDSIGHEVQKFLPDDNSQLAILGVIAKGVIGLQDSPNGGERLIHHCKRLRSVQIDSGGLRSHRLPPHLLQAGVFMLSATGARCCLLPEMVGACAFAPGIANL
jgi:hypothetical protein